DRQRGQWPGRVKRESRRRGLASRRTHGGSILGTAGTVPERKVNHDVTGTTSVPVVYPSVYPRRKMSSPGIKRRRNGTRGGQHRTRPAVGAAGPAPGGRRCLLQ